MDKGLVLAPIFSNGMILQRDQEIILYGTEAKAATVSVIFMEKEYTSTVEGDGDFLIKLPPTRAGGPYKIKVVGSEVIYIEDVLFGDVFLLTGQSNMELPLRRVLDVSAEEINHTYQPEIRQYLIPGTYQFNEPKKHMYASTWKNATGEDLMGFSAAGYFFAKEIKETYKVPVGLILAAVGGSTIEAWMSPAACKKLGISINYLNEFYDLNYFNKYMEKQQEACAEWRLKLEDDEINLNLEENYINWDVCVVPSLISDYCKEPFQGTVYLCRELTLMEEQISDTANIYMGTIIDSDCIWINGHFIGRTEYRYPPRKYKIPKGVLRKGSNLILIRIMINRENGGTIKGRPYYISYNNKQISLEGKWYYQIGKVSKIPMPEIQYPTRFPTGLYHTAIAPLAQISLKGILWYQGESNTLEPKGYSEKFTEMLQSWRTIFKKEIPCIYVQLPGYQEPLDKREDTGWAELRQQQLQSLSINQVAMVVTLDLGEYNDLHPQNKKGVGIRLAEAAKYLIYAENNTLYNGPIPSKGYANNNQVCLYFHYLEDSKEEELINNFELAGSDYKFYSAQAVRKGAIILITSDYVSVPRYVRYAWRDNPENINFYNHAGLPAAGFCMELS